MCGLYGWIGSFTAREREALANSLPLLNVLRGSHSWGCSLWTGPGGWSPARGLGDATRVAPLLARFSAVLGHTRFATFGKVTVENAHPFAVGSILLAHNGVVSNHYELARAGEDYEVDSQLIARRIAAGLPLTDLEGYGTITWTDSEDPLCVRLCNVGQGDLAFAHVRVRGEEKVRGTVWSSERSHLTAALGAAAVDYDLMKVDPGVVYKATTTGLRKTDATLGWRERAPMAGKWSWVDEKPWWSKRQTRKEKKRERYSGLTKQDRKLLRESTILRLLEAKEDEGTTAAPSDCVVDNVGV